METKICCTCKRTKEISEFNFKNKKKGRRGSKCRECSRAYVKAHYRKNAEQYKRRALEFRTHKEEETMQKLMEYLKSHPCVDCGERDIVVLQFDHLRDKIAQVPSLSHSGYSWDTILFEIEKCEVRCANCHIRRTAKEKKWRWRCSSARYLENRL